MIVVVDCAASVDVCPKKLEGVFVIDADFGECAAKDGGDWFVSGQDYAEDVVDVGDVVWGFDPDFFLLR